MTDRSSQIPAGTPPAADDPLLYEARRIYRRQSYRGAAPAWSPGARRSAAVRDWLTAMTVVLMLVTAAVLWRVGQGSSSPETPVEMVIAESPLTAAAGERPELVAPLPAPVAERETAPEVPTGPSGVSGPAESIGPAPAPGSGSAGATATTNSAFEHLPKLRRRALELRPDAAPRLPPIRLRSSRRPAMPRPPRAVRLSEVAPLTRSGR